MPSAAEKCFSIFAQRNHLNLDHPCQAAYLSPPANALKGVLFTVHKALPLLAGGGSIILNASIVVGKGLASNSVCNATKATVLVRAHLDP